MFWKGDEPRTLKQKTILFVYSFMFFLIIVIFKELTGHRGKSLNQSRIYLDELPEALPEMITFSIGFALVMVLFNGIGRKKKVKIETEKEIEEMTKLTDDNKKKTNRN